MAGEISAVAARAVVPDQLVDYVSAVSGLKSGLVGKFLIHHGDGTGVLVGYGAEKDELESVLATELGAFAEAQKLTNLVLLAPEIPANIPKDATIEKDHYWLMPLSEQKRPQKLRNMLKRASREVRVNIDAGSGAFSPKHAAMVNAFCASKPLSDGTKYIFSRLENYLANSPEALLFSANNDFGEPVAFAIGDFSAMSTAFYMFAIRDPGAPPGCADLLLDSIFAKAVERGHEFLNLGLGIDTGIEFFKKKWGAKPGLPYHEISWTIKKQHKSWFAKLFKS